MINKYIKNIFNFINYFTLACIIPIGYFAPLGEWLLLSLLSIITLLNICINYNKINYNNFFIFIISILIIFISYFFSINPERSYEVIGPISGLLFAIFIIINITSKNKILNIENFIGIPLIITTMIIFLDLTLNTEIRTSLATLAGDQPTSNSGNYSRGIIILSMIMPFSVSMYLDKNKKSLALLVFTLVSAVIIIGPNSSAKLALMITYITAIIIYFFGPRAFSYFGIISVLFILFLPIFSKNIIPIVSSINKSVKITEICIEIPIYAANTNFQFKCEKKIPWQESKIGGSIIHRLLVFEFVGNKIYDKPLIGHGIGTSRLIGQDAILNIPNSNLIIKGAIPLHPHNNFLEIWLELGLLGIIIFNILWIKIIKFCANKRRESFIIGTGLCTSIVNMFIIANLSFGAFQAWWISSIALIFLTMLQYFNEQYIK